MPVSNNEIIFIVIFITLILLLLVAGIAITFFVTIRQKLEQDMKLKQVDLDYQKELRDAEAEVSEMVRTNIGRDLHDNIGHLLTHLRFQLENKMLDNPAYESDLQPLLETLVDVKEQIRMLSRSLSSDYLKDKTFKDMLQLETARVNQLKGLKVHWQDDEEELQLNKDQQLITFRICQEIISNSLKHAEARNIYIQLQGGNSFRLSLADDGKGFDPEAVAAASNGIRNIKKRAEMAGMYCNIYTAPSKGCTVVIGANPPVIALNQNKEPRYEYAGD